MNIEWTDSAWDDYLYWVKTDSKIKAKINSLVQSIESTPYSGIGKPEALKHGLSGYWSRRINREHRLVYKVTTDKVVIIACRYHY